VKNKILSISLAAVLALSVGLIGCAGEVLPEYSLTISTTEGGSVTSPGESGPYTYDEGEVVNLVAEADEGYEFVAWTGNVDNIADTEDFTTTITMNDDYSITANFIKQYDLIISSTPGGSVTAPGEGTYAYDEGEVVNLVAQAEEGYHFVNWTGDVSTIADVNATITSITMNSSCIITANFAVDLYFQADAKLGLSGPAASPPGERDPWVSLDIYTNIVMNSVQVDLPDGRVVIAPPYGDAFGPEVNGITVLRFCTNVAGMPIAGGEYVFTGLDMAGEPIPGARNSDIWVGVEPPAPPTNVRAEITEDGILASWDESPLIPSSFEPAAVPQLGWYQLSIDGADTGEPFYGASGISVSPYLVPRDKTNFTGKDHGVSLSEMEDGRYCLSTCVHSIAPEGSSGRGIEYVSTDPSQNVIFTIQDGEITVE
jgi:hypothetical protein